jgi:hypothetical protein
MNVFRSLARDVWNLMDASRLSKAAGPEAGGRTLNAVREQRVPGVLSLTRFRDGFEQFPQGVNGTLRTLQAERAFRPMVSAASLQRDGFDAGRRAPVDLSGGVKVKPLATTQDPVAAAAPASNGFTASLDDLAALL